MRTSGASCLALDFGGTIAGPGRSPSGSDVDDVLRYRFGFPATPGLAAAVDRASSASREAYRGSGRQGSLEEILQTAARSVHADLPDLAQLAAVVWDAVPDAAVADQAADAIRKVRAAGYIVMLACNTRRPAASRMRTLSAAGLEGCFASLVMSSEIGSPKPAPQFYATVLAEARKHAGCGPDGIVFVGDSLGKDVTGPIEAGMHAVLVQPTSRPSVLPSGARQISCLAELPDLLGQWP